MSDPAAPLSGRKPVVSDAEILEAGRRLQEEGKEVTGYSLRKAVGRGTFSKMIKVWRAHAEPVPTPEAESQPALYQEALETLRGTLREQATEMVDGLLTSAWQTATRVAEDRVADQVARLQAALADRDQTIVELEEVLEKADQAAADLVRERDQLSSDLGSTALKLQQSEEAAARDAERIRGLDEALATERDRVQAAQAARAAAEATATAVREDADRLRGELASERVAHQAIVVEAGEVRIALEQARANLVAAKATEQALRDDHGRLCVERAEDRATLERIQADLMTARAAQAAAEAAIGAVREEAERIRGELATERTGRDRLVERAVAAEAEVRRLEAQAAG